MHLNAIASAPCQPGCEICGRAVARNVSGGGRLSRENNRCNSQQYGSTAYAFIKRAIECAGDAPSLARLSSGPWARSEHISTLLRCDPIDRSASDEPARTRPQHYSRAIPCRHTPPGVSLWRPPSSITGRRAQSSSPAHLTTHGARIMPANAPGFSNILPFQYTTVSPSVKPQKCAIWGD